MVRIVMKRVISAVVVLIGLSAPAAADFHGTRGV